MTQNEASVIERFRNKFMPNEFTETHLHMPEEGGLARHFLEMDVQELEQFILSELSRVREEVVEEIKNVIREHYKLQKLTGIEEVSFLCEWIDNELSDLKQNKKEEGE